MSFTDEELEMAGEALVHWYDHVKHELTRVELSRYQELCEKIDKALNP